MNILSFTPKTGDCYAAIIETLYDTSKDIFHPEFIKEKPGIKISVYGQTEKTKV